MKYIPAAILLLLLACSSSIQYPAGGYDYPKQVADKDTNLYQYYLKDSLSIKDSMLFANEFQFYKNFGEPNLSIKPMDEETFRFSYSGFKTRTIIIILKPKMITVKIADPFENYEPIEEKLDKTEFIYYNLFRKYFPIEESKKKRPALEKRLDSIVKIYPKLSDANYFQELINKSAVHFSYSEKRIPISKETFSCFVTLINNSGFWSMPYRIDCEAGTDGAGFSLEANTKKKYKIVSSSGCRNDDKSLDTACQKLIDFVQLQKEIMLVSAGTETKKPVFIQDVQLEEIKTPPHKKNHPSNHR